MFYFPKAGAKIKNVFSIAKLFEKYFQIIFSEKETQNKNLNHQLLNETQSRKNIE